MPSAMVIRPVILIAYGDTGLEWLQLVEGDLRRRKLGSLVDERQIQLLCFGGRADPGTDWAVECYDGVPSPEQLRILLDRSRIARFGAEQRDIQIVCVVERWSLFATPSAPRPELRKALETARRVNASQAGGPEFGLNVVVLLDGVRPQRAIAPDQVESTRAQVASCDSTDVHLLIDRADAVGGPITLEVADQTYRRLVQALVSPAVLYAARLDQGLWWGHNMDGDVRVIPFSLLTLHHSLGDLQKARANVLCRRIGSESIQADPRGSREPSPSLSQVIRDDLSEIRTVPTRSFAHHAGAMQSVSELLRRAFILRDRGVEEELKAASAVLKGGRTPQQRDQ